ncbi:transporter substrate-binding domain-containing protein [Nocardioides sp. zg-1228]|uniref:transporter substrate-binding domain-containing protein n=1 Tax=Nocardioides sp. zg-1228 TaxID=2763008 RepID=UPI0016423A79|nr:transporter substrate-binding domain-containing protein [Nocardioides sp. zg-1228]MBC2934574.1 transporter substrate-binding domain-containing protein [Nocardioides sp. zg-1228]QSF59327.1 transporter substrate-binding domain-containing protein [Nocardioides sp. zg-1228]
MNKLPRRMTDRRRTGAIAALATAALMTLAACGDDGGDAASDEPRLINDGELVIAMSGEFQPFSYFEDNELTGFDYDIGVAIAEEMGLEPKTETGAFDTLIQGVKSQRYDVLIASMTPTEERDRAVDFTDSYYTSGATMFVAQDSDCEDPREMDSPKVGVASGTTYQTFLEDEGLAGEVVTFTSDVTALQDVDAGRLDGAMTDRLVGLYQIDRAERDLRACGDPLYSEEPAFAVDEGNTALVDELNDALAAIKDDGTYAEISEKWFGQDIS